MISEVLQHQTQLQEISKTLWAIPTNERTPQQVADLFTLDNALFLCNSREYNWLLKIRGQKWIDNELKKTLEILDTYKLKGGYTR